MEFCRICATSTSADVESVSIFGGIEPIANMIQELSGLEILDEYGLPDVVCYDCVNRLKSALELKQQCLKSDEKFRRLIQQESILETVYERKADPDVPIISYKILYDQVIEHVPPEIETEYIVEVEANTLERVSKPNGEKVKIEYINPPIETIPAKVEEIRDFPTDVETSCAVEVETNRFDEFQNAAQNEKLIKSTTLEHYTFYKDVDGSIGKDKLPSTKVEVPFKLKTDCTKKEDSLRKTKKAKPFKLREKANESEVEAKPSKRKQLKDKEQSTKSDDKDNGRPFRCCGCERTFSTKLELLQHSKESHASQKTSNRERPFECTICYKRYTSARGFKIHRKNAYQLKQHQCSSCGKRFLNRTLLENHERTHTSLKPFSCTHCSKTFRSKSNLLSHLKLHSEIPEHTKHVCKLCNKGFSRKSYLKHHNSLLHSEETPFECTFCPNRFKAKANLRLHLRTHTQERPYSCEMCDKSFMYPTDRKRHMLQHTGQKPFKCKECDKGFTRKTLLNKHQISHRSETATGGDG